MVTRYFAIGPMKFSIRDLFLVTVIVAVCVAWWIDHRHQTIVNEQLAKELGNLQKPIMSYPSESEWKRLVEGHKRP